MLILRLRVKYPICSNGSSTWHLTFGGATARFTQAAGWTKSHALYYSLVTLSMPKLLFDMNLITEICPEGTELKRAIELAEHIAQAVPLAVKRPSPLLVRAVNEGYKSGF